jgi:HAD superfamily hydrolase (TIGR01549 family)
VKRLEAIIFDFDGVLVESVDVKTQAFSDMYAEYGPEIVEKVIAYHVEHGGVSRYKKFRYYQETLLGKHLSSEEEKTLGDTFSRLVKDAVVAAAWVPGAYEFLSAYYRTCALFIASGTPEEEMREIIRLREMTHFFVSVHGTPASKAEIIEHICTRHGFNRRFVLMVGDAETDYEGALSAGVRFVGRVPEGQGGFLLHVPVIPDLRTLHEYY